MSIGDLITDEWQCQWRGTLLGWPETSLVITNVTGWLDGPPTRSNPVDRPGQHGQFPSDLKASSRVIEVDLSDLDDDPTVFRAFRRAIALGENDGEEPLVIWLDDQPYLSYARLEKVGLPTDIPYSLGYRRMVLQYVATDPRLYGLTEYTVPLGLPTPATGGLAFPLAFPLNFGVGRGPSTGSFVNYGSVPTWPTFTLNGPITGPIITNRTTGDQLIFNPGFDLLAGQQLVIDTLERDVYLTTGQSRRGELYTAQWFPLAPGGQTLALNSVGGYDPAALVTATWRDAWL